MQSKTKIKLSLSQINRVMHSAFGKNAFTYEEVVNGFYNTIYKIVFEDKTVYLKIAPGKDIDILTYEKDIIRTECKLYETCYELNIPAPKVLFKDFTKSIISSDYYIMSEIKGKTIHELRDTLIDKTAYYMELMKYVALLHNELQNHFGYDTADKHFKTYSETIFNMFDNVLLDAQRKSVVLPNHIKELIGFIHNYKDLLDELKEPSLLHFDLWDGNILVDESGITGLIDGERSFNGHPIADFVCMNFDLLDSNNQDIIDQYNKHSNYHISINKKTRILFYIHRAYLFFIMFVECAYRDISGSFDWQKSWAETELKEILYKIKIEEVMPYSKITTVDMWNDPYISKQMLKYHLEKDNDIASRSMDKIKKTVDFISTEINPHSKICDYGCGPGLYTDLLQKKGFDVIGIDVSANSLHYAKEQNKSVRYFNMNYIETKVDENIDLAMMIYCDFGAMSIVNQKKFLSNLHSTLNDDGLFFFDVFSVHRFERLRESTIKYQETDGFFMEGDAMIASQTIKFPNEKVSLSYDVAIGKQIVELYNWDTHYDIIRIKDLLESNGFEVLDFYTDTFGNHENKDSDIIFVKCKKLNK